MTAVSRLVTLVDVDDVADTRQMSVSARHEAELVDGRRVLLLDDRGWTSLPLLWASDVSAGHASREAVLDVWGGTSVEDIDKSARAVVGPDEPIDGGSRQDAEAAHWLYLAGVLRRQGVIVDAPDLKRLPHDIVLSERLRARLGRDPGEAVSP